jgi:hypothetical protein
MFNLPKKLNKIIKSVQDENIENPDLTRQYPILIPSDLNEYNIDGFAKLHHENSLESKLSRWT